MQEMEQERHMLRKVLAETQEQLRAVSAELNGLNIAFRGSRPRSPTIGGSGILRSRAAPRSRQSSRRRCRS